MKKLAVLAFLGFASTFNAMAQSDMDVYESDRRYCASGRSGVDFRTCMWRIQNDRERYEQRQYYDQRQNWGRPPPPPAPPPYARQWQPPPEKPKLSDMQQRALDNCIMLAPKDQPRCRATVMSTVR